ncbi:MAG: hypothetical protein R6V85_10290 [Polyangia bacterium]
MIDFMHISCILPDKHNLALRHGSMIATLDNKLLTLAREHGIETA